MLVYFRFKFVRVFKRKMLFLLCFSLTLSFLFLPALNTSSEVLEREFVMSSAEPNQRFEGYNLFVLEKCDAEGLIPINRTFLITDLEGNIYFKKEYGKEANLDFFGVEFINSTTILQGDHVSAKLWNLETNVTQDLNIYGHHDYERNYANDTYFAISKYTVDIDGTLYLFDKVREYLQDGTLIWELDTRSFTNQSQWCPYEDMVENYRDITHTNTVFYDEDEDVIYICCRTLNTIYKIDHKTQDVLWALGEYGNFKLFDINGKEIDIMFYHAHAVEKISEDSFILFDNDEHNQTDNMNHQSRMLEFKIDEDKMQANVTWQWIGSEEYYTGWWGDCDVLPNNNRLAVFGTPWHPKTSIGARLVEVNYEGDIVWEMFFDKEGTECFGVYKMERFHFAPIVSTPRFNDLGDNGSLFEWDVWYNFRSKTIFQGKYYISIDGNLVETGDVNFPKYWQATQIKFYVNESLTGEHEIELVVADEAGHLSNESDRYSSTGILTFKISKRIELIIGLSVGLGSLILICSFIFVRIKIFKKPIFKRKV